MFEAIAGASVIASAAIALLFLRFWQQTRDRLFLIFALAFAMFAVNRVLLSALDDESEAQTLVYLARGLTFALIAVAIVDKNWPMRTKRPTAKRPGVSEGSRRGSGRRSAHGRYAGSRSTSGRHRR